MSCKFAEQNNGFYLCNKNMDECLFEKNPDSKRCTEMYGIYSKDTSQSSDDEEDQILEEIYCDEIEE